MTVYEVDGLARQRIGQVFRFDYRLTAAYDRIVGIVIRLVIAPRVIDQALFPDPATFPTAGNRLRRSIVVTPSHGGGTK